jgi:multidrug resistance efflux pump
MNPERPRHHYGLFFLVFFLIIAIAYVGYRITRQESSGTHESTVLTLSDLTARITVSGKVEALHAVHLAFPVIGTVQRVMHEIGAEVQKGEVLASLTKDSLIAQYTEALHAVSYFRSHRDALVRGPISSDRLVTISKEKLARAELLQTEQIHDQLVQNAYQTLLSSDLEAVPSYGTNNDTAPTITGNYLCREKGSYTLSIFKSGAATGYSYRLGGMESGIYPLPRDTKAPLGTCGLSIQFANDTSYKDDTWTITIPNTQSTSYLTNKLAYEETLTTRNAAVEEKNNALDVVVRSGDDRNAIPGKEELAQAEAQVAQAEALLALREAQIAEYTIRAPFSGIITDVDIKEGEAADLSRTITLMQDGAYELIAQIPETDIASVTVGDRADVVFDAQPHEPLQAEITFISPLSNTRKGVAYYEARLSFAQTPSWMREGLNADVRITTARRSQVTVVPRTYVQVDAYGSFIFVEESGVPTRVNVTPGIIGEEGLVELLNMEPGKTAVMPQ